MFNFCLFYASYLRTYLQYNCCRLHEPSLLLTCPLHVTVYYSSPARSPGMDSGTMMMNNVYRERFPKVIELLFILLFKLSVLLSASQSEYL